MRRQRRGARGAFAMLGRAAAGLFLSLVFTAGAFLALVLYANLPAGRRIVALALQRALANTFEGGFSIDAVDQVSLSGLHARGISVRDPDGHLVLSVSALSVQADLPGLLRKLLLGVGNVTLRFDHARLERAEVFLLPGQNNVPTIVDAFMPARTPTSPGPSRSVQTLKVWFPEIEIGHIYGRMALDGVPTLETELASVRGSVVGSSALTTVDVERFSALVRGLGGADARGVASVHVRTPGAVWTSFDGYFGDVQLGAVVRVDSPKLDIALDVPRAEPAAVRALWSAYPLLQELGAHVEAVGTLQSLHTEAKFSIGRGTITSSGELRLSQHPGADLDISGRILNLQSVWPGAPSTELDVDLALAVFQSGSDWLTNVRGTTAATRISGTPIPAIDVSGSYGSNGFLGHGTWHEPGMPTNATFEVHPDGSIDVNAQAKRVDLSRVPRLHPYFDGRGVLDLQIKARIVKNRLTAQLSGDLNSLEYGPVTAASNHFSGRASGPLDDPGKLSVDLAFASKRLKAGAFRFDELQTKLSGPITRPLVSTTITNQYGPVITAKARLTPRSAPRIDDLSLEVRRDQAALIAQVTRIDIDGDDLRVSGLSLSGAGGKLEASGRLGPEHLAVVAHGSSLDLGLISHALGLPSSLLRGTLAVDADFESTQKTQRGTFQLQLDHGESEGVAIDSLTLQGGLSGSELTLHSAAKLRDFGSFSAEAVGTLRGSLADQRTWHSATGSLTAQAEHVPLGLLSYALPTKSGVGEVRGEVSASIMIDARVPNALPDLSFTAHTTGLYVGLSPRDKAEKGKVIDGVDAQAGVSVNGKSGQTELTFKLTDRHGTLVTATTALTVDLPRAVDQPGRLVEQLRETPLIAKAVVLDRALEDLPPPFANAGVQGRLRTELSLRGTLDRPIFSDKIELNRLRLGENTEDHAIDVCAQLDYDKTSGQYGLRGELFLPTENARACQGSRVAQLSAGGRAEWSKLTSTAPIAEPAWTGTAGLSLEGLPLAIVPWLAEAGVEGRVRGVVMFDRREALPQIRSQLEVADAIIARTRFGTAAIQAQTDGRTLSASLRIDEPASGPAGAHLPGGKLEAELQSSLNFQGVIPGIDESRPMAVKLRAKDVDAAILAPLLHDVLSEIGGKLNADLSATLTPDPDPTTEHAWTGAVKGALSMHDGTLQLAQLALRMQNVKFSATAEPRANETAINIDSFTAAAEADRPNIAAHGSLHLSGFRVVRGNAIATVQGVPLLVEGVPLATLNGKEVAIELERRPAEMFVGLTIPELEAKLPQAAARSLIALGSNESIEIVQPIAEPEAASDGQALPWRLKFALGSRVKITRADLFLPISGSPEIVLGEQLQIVGNIELGAGGRLSLPGLPRAFTIEHGTVFFDMDGEPQNPRLNVRAACQLSQLTVWATVTGTFRDAKVRFESSDPSLSETQIEAALLSAPTDSSSPAAAGLGAGAGYLGKQLLANTALSNLEIKAGSETTADQNSYSTYSAAYPISDKIWFEGSYKSLQRQDLTGANSNAFSGTLDFRFRRNWSLRTEVGNIGGGVDLLWLYRY